MRSIIASEQNEKLVKENQWKLILFAFKVKNYGTCAAPTFRESLFFSTEIRL